MIPRAAIPSLLFAIACVGCEQRTSAPVRADLNALDAATLAIYEAVIPVSSDDAQHMHCLQIDSRDPSEEIVSTLIASGHAVAPASACTFSIKQQGFHNETRKPAIFQRIAGLEIFSGVTASADLSTAIHGLNASHYRVELRFDGTKWFIESRVLTAVS